MRRMYDKLTQEDTTLSLKYGLHFKSEPSYFYSSLLHICGKSQALPKKTDFLSLQAKENQTQLWQGPAETLSSHPAGPILRF